MCSHLLKQIILNYLKVRIANQRRFHMNKFILMYFKIYSLIWLRLLFSILHAVFVRITTEWPYHISYQILLLSSPLTHTTHLKEHIKYSAENYTIVTIH